MPLELSAAYIAPNPPPVRGKSENPVTELTPTKGAVAEEIRMPACSVKLSPSALVAE
jgi:hypothetical protein